MPTSIKIPIIEMMITAMSMMSVRKKFLAEKITAPRPVAVPRSSAATSVPQETPSATRMPVKISGRALGMITLLRICILDAPSE